MGWRMPLSPARKGPAPHRDCAVNLASDQRAFKGRQEADNSSVSSPGIGLESYAANQALKPADVPSLALSFRNAIRMEACAKRSSGVAIAPGPAPALSAFTTLRLSPTSSISPWCESSHYLAI